MALARDMETARAVLRANVPFPNIAAYTPDLIKAATTYVQRSGLMGDVFEYMPWKNRVTFSVRNSKLTIRAQSQDGSTYKTAISLRQQDVGLVRCAGTHKSFKAYLNSASKTLFSVKTPTELRDILVHEEFVPTRVPVMTKLASRVTGKTIAPTLETKFAYTRLPAESRVTNVRLDADGITYWTDNDSYFVPNPAMAQTLTHMHALLRSSMPAGLHMFETVGASMHFPHGAGSFTQ